VLTSTGTSTAWSATSSLGLGDGTFLGLSDTPSAYSAGSILFTSGSGVASNTDQFFWDNANNRLGIGTSSPSSKLSVWGSGTSDLLTVATTSGATTTYAMHIDQAGDVYLGTTTRPSFAETAKLVVAEGGVVNTPAAAPKEVGTIVDGGSVTGLAGAISVTVAGRYAYVAGYNDGALAIIDVSDPQNPEEVGVICDSGSGCSNDTATGLNGATSVTVAGRYAYVVGQSDHALAIIDISDPANPEEVGVISDDEFSHTAQ
jgi:Uncharacterized conserved protein